MNRRENYLCALTGGKPEWVPNYSTDSQVFAPSAMNDPYAYLYGVYYDMLEKGETPKNVRHKDGFGVTWVLDEYGAIPDSKNILLDDVDEWKEKFTIPDISDYDWDERLAEETAALDPDKAVEMVITGPFMQMVNAMGFENALVALVSEPDESKEFLDAVIGFVTDGMVNTLKRTRIDVIQLFDDFANSRSMFMSPELFREILLPYEKKIIDMAKEVDPNVVIHLHACGVCQDVLGDLVDAGVQAWQPAQDINDLDAIQKKYGSRLALCGVWDNVSICAAGQMTEAAVRRSVRNCIDRYGKDGGYIFWEGGPVGFGEVTTSRLAWANDEAETYGHSCYAAL